MPSTLVHVAIGGLVGAALLGDRFTPKAIAIVLVAAALPDLDSFLAPLISGAHRSALHTFLLPALLATLLYADTRVAERSRLRARFGPEAGYVGAVALVGLFAGGVLPDLVTNGVNALWPLHDQFYTLNGELELSTTEGVVQTFVDLSPERAPATTQNTRYSTGADPTPWTDDRPVERTFPVVSAGWQLMLVGLSAATVGVRSWQTRASAGAGVPGAVAADVVEAAGAAADEPADDELAGDEPADGEPSSPGNDSPKSEP